MSEDKTIQSLGGEARAAALTKDERAEIARKAANSRWLVKATHGSEERPLRIGDIEIPCYVLADRRRVIATAGVMTSLDLSTGKGGLVRIATLLKKFSPNDRNYLGLISSTENPIAFLTPNGARALGVEAGVLPSLCEAILAADRDGLLKGNQGHMAERARVLLRGFAEVGIIALVDEATGFQFDRDRNELHKILAAYISESLLPWTERFSNEFFSEMFRLWGWKMHPTGKGPRGPRYAGKLVKELVYKQLPTGVIEKLEEKNPVGGSGQRRHRHHQFLSDGIGNSHLEKHVASVTTLMKASPDKETFKKLFARAFPDRVVEDAFADDEAVTA